MESTGPDCLSRRQLFPSFRRPPVIIHRDTPGWRLQVVELPVAHCPEEGGDRGDQQHEAEGNQQVEAVHAATPSVLVPGAASAAAAAGAAGSRPSRSALKVTSSELADMPIAATHGASRPSAASGTAMAL